MRKYDFVPQPFVIRSPFQESSEVQTGDPSSFAIRLFGPAIDFHPYIIYAVQQMGERGLGRDRVPFDLLSVSDGESELLSQHAITPPARQALLEESAGSQNHSRLHVTLETPLRLKTDGQFNSSPSLSDIMRAVARRLRILSHFYGDDGEETVVPKHLLQAADESVLLHQETTWHQIKRRSARQGVRMSLDGLIGTLVFEVPDPQLIPWLQAGARVHVGKATSFGYGRMVVEALPNE